MCSLSTDTDFLCFGLPGVRANYKRELKKYSEQRSNRGELQTSLIYYLLGIHIPICPQYQNPDSYRRAAMYSTETISSLPGLAR